MMREGLQKTITVKRRVQRFGQDRALIEGWVSLAHVRAWITARSIEARDCRTAKAPDQLVIFRTRLLDGISSGDYLTICGGTFEIIEAKKVQSRRSLELVCRADQLLSHLIRCNLSIEYGN